LSTLFIERQFLRVTQPSEMAKAGRVSDLIGSGGLKTISEDKDVISAESKEIGQDLATLLALAKRDSALVVRSAPVSKLGTFLEESADMSVHSAILADTHAVLSFLAQTGAIDADQIQSGTDYLYQVDKGWSAAMARSSTASWIGATWPKSLRPAAPPIWTY
jgi:hypothetical protein